MDAGFFLQCQPLISIPVCVYACWNQPLVSWRQMKRCASIRSHRTPTVLLAVSFHFYFFPSFYLAHLTHLSSTVSNMIGECRVFILDRFTLTLLCFPSPLSDCGVQKGRLLHTDLLSDGRSVKVEERRHDGVPWLLVLSDAAPATEHNICSC